jgi:acyl-CoA thioester hydrolase
MARSKLDLPEKFDFSIEMPIRISDINAGNHLAASAILPMAHDARMRFMMHYGFTESNVDGCGVIMADSVTVYKSQGFYGQTLKIEIAVSDFTKKSCDFLYRITDRDTGTEIARLKTCMVFFDYKKQKSVDVPAKFKSLFEPGI